MTTWARGRSLEHNKLTAGFCKSRNVTTTTTSRSARACTLYCFVYTSRILRNILVFIRRFVPTTLNTSRPLSLSLSPCIYCRSIIVHFIMFLSLSFPYRASSTRVTISITNRCDFCFISLFHISLLTLHVSGLHRPIIRGISS
jgi:uncharacterized membrane protein (DUF4010 family)